MILALASRSRETVRPGPKTFSRRPIRALMRRSPATDGDGSGWRAGPATSPPSRTPAAPTQLAMGWKHVYRAIVTYQVAPSQLFVEPVGNCPGTVRPI